MSTLRVASVAWLPEQNIYHLVGMGILFCISSLLFPLLCVQTNLLPCPLQGPAGKTATVVGLAAGCKILTQKIQILEDFTSAESPGPGSSLGSGTSVTQHACQMLSRTNPSSFLGSRVAYTCPTSGKLTCKHRIHGQLAHLASSPNNTSGMCPGKV